MTNSLARMPFLAALSLLSFLPHGIALPPTAPAPRAWAALPAEKAERVVFLAGEMSDEKLIAFSSALAASGHPGVLLLDTPPHSEYMKSFLTAFSPEQVLPAGGFCDGPTKAEKRLGVRLAAPLKEKHGQPADLWRALFPKAERVVVSPAEPRCLLIQSAYLAAVLKAPLFVVRGEPEEPADLRRWVAEWGAREVHAVGPARAICRTMPGVRVLTLADADAVAAVALKHQTAKGALHTLVVANPADSRRGTGNMSCLAPWLAVQRRAALVLTNDDGNDTSAAVSRALKHPKLRAADTAILMADLQAIPTERRPNPLAGKEATIEMEPLTPAGTEPVSFATGRLFHPDPGVVTLMLARQRLLEARRVGGAKRKALIVSNPGDDLPLLEMFSRNTVQEFRNRGYQTTARFGTDVTKDDLRRELPGCDVFLWEGHHNTLIREWGFHTWDEPLPPSFLFLQSCLALVEPEVHPLLQRGAVGIVGSSTRTYSGSGGAFALAFFNAMLYEGKPLGSSLRHAKNFLLAYSLLKEKRLGEPKLQGANLRSAWAFTLWGDPTLTLPQPDAEPTLAPVHHKVKGDTIVVALPDTAYEQMVSGSYRAAMRPNARLAGLIRPDADARKHLVPFVFTEVRLPQVPANCTPRLTSRLPDKHWVFCWDGRRRCGYLLVTPRPRDQRELRFHVTWEESPGVEASAGE